MIDDHWINDPILELVEADGSVAVPDAVWPQVAQVREAVLETISTFGPPGINDIFTYAGSDEDPEDRKAFEDYRAVAGRRGSRFIAVRLVFSEQELVRRIQSVERLGRKITDPEEAVENVRSFTPLDPRRAGSLCLDVT